jgi:hypothetical protein
MSASFIEADLVDFLEGRRLTPPGSAKAAVASQPDQPRLPSSSSSSSGASGSRSGRRAPAAGVEAVKLTVWRLRSWRHDQSRGYRGGSDGNVHGAVGGARPVGLLESGVDHQIRLDGSHQVSDLLTAPDIHGVPRRADRVGRA